jgi:hypothetical protein
MLRAAGGLCLYYLVAVLSCFLVVAMLASVRVQSRLHSDADLFGMIRLLLPVDADAMRQLFDPSEEWKLQACNRPETFKLIQINRRKLAIQYASHMFRNAHILQRVGYAGRLSRRADEIIKGKLLVDAGVPVRLRSALLLVFLRFQQLTYAGANLSSVKDIVADLLPEWDELLYAAFNLGQLMDPNLHAEMTRLLAPSVGYIP